MTCSSTWRARRRRASTAAAPAKVQLSVCWGWELKSQLAHYVQTARSVPSKGLLRQVLQRGPCPRRARVRRYTLLPMSARPPAKLSAFLGSLKTLGANPSLVASPYVHEEQAMGERSGGRTGGREAVSATRDPGPCQRDNRIRVDFGRLCAGRVRSNSGQMCQGLGQARPMPATSDRIRPT